jgi:ABC-type branched-subunit amino acid transport system substrate-binding protein
MSTLPFASCASRHPSGWKSLMSSNETWPVGILFSRSGIVKVSESEHFRGTVLAVEELNAAGGILGREIAPVCYDPMSSVSEYRRLADKLLTEDSVSIIFGCMTSASRKAILAALERRNGLLWYPGNYEGFEYSPNIIYTGAAPNQHTLQLGRFLIQKYGSDIALVGSDYIFPRETNRVFRYLVESSGGRIVSEAYVPWDPDDITLKRIVSGLARDKPSAVVCTIIGRGVGRFYQIYREEGIDPKQCPIGSLSVAETEVQVIGPQYCTGHITAGAYFDSVRTPATLRFRDAFRRRYGESEKTSLYSESGYNQVHLFAAALERAGALDPERIVAAAGGIEFEAPQGQITIDAANNHTWLTPRIGIINESGGFDVAWEANAPVRPDPYLVDHSFESLNEN